MSRHPGNTVVLEQPEAMGNPSINHTRPRGMPRLLTLQAASVSCGVPVNSLRDLVLRGHLASISLPGCRRIYLDGDDLRALLERSKAVRNG